MSKFVTEPQEIGFNSYYEWYQSVENTNKLENPQFDDNNDGHFYWAYSDDLIKSTIKELVAEIQMLKSVVVNNLIMDLEETIKQLKGQ